jgi:rhodanese-related sulfurtransferase
VPDSIRPQGLKDWLANCTAADAAALPVVLDVREPWEVQLATVQADGFELRTIPMADIPARLDELPRDRSIACLCHHGVRSARVTHFLHAQGFDDVVNITGGIDAWSVEFDPTVPRY